MSRVRTDTVVALLCERAADHPDKVAYRFDSADGRPASALTYGDLLREARRSATALLEVAGTGDRVLLALPQGLAFVTTFFGCLAAGLVAVPAYPPRRARTEPRLTQVIRDCMPSAIVCLPADRAAMVALLQPPDRESHVLCTPLAGDLEGVGDHIAGDAIAFLQYTSGSTGDPKGVVVTHENILHNEAAIAEAFSQSSDDLLVSWLPLFHDMGLVGNLLQTLYAGSQCVLLPPDVVVHRPEAWLRAIASYRATTSGGPNFIYARCEQRVRDEDIDGLDLACWRVAYNGSERVHASTLRAFATRFERYGFRRSSFRPCYGLAESTLLVSASREWSPSDDDVSCGTPASGTDVRVVDPESCQQVRDGAIGEIWVASPGVARGYWNRGDAEATFGARLPRSPLRYLRTGDLGCLRGGELFVVDRLKDLVIVRGRNVVPADAEDAALAAHPAWRASAAAAFGVVDGATEALAVVLEAPREGGDDWQRAAREIRFAIAERLDIEPAIIAFVRRGVLPRTSSGKIARHLVKRRHEAGELPTLHTWRAPAAVDFGAGSTRTTVLAIVQRALGLEDEALDLAAPLCALGLDSMRAVEIAHALEAQLGRVVRPARLLDDVPLGMLLEEIEGRDLDVKRPPSPSRRTSELSAGQRGLWLLHQHDPTSPHYHVAAAFKLTGRIDRAHVIDGLREIARNHEALRWMIRGPESAVIAEAIEPVLSWRDWPDCSDDDLAGYVRDEAGRPLATGEDAPPWRVHAIRRSMDLVLLLVMHHAIADLWSVAVLASDLRAIADGMPVAPEPCPYSDFVAEERAWRASAAAESLEYWKRALADAPGRLALPIARATPEQGRRQSRIRVSLTAAETERVRRLARTHACTPYVVMLSAWQAILARYSGRHRFLIGAIGSHRAHVHRRTVGYFVNPWIVRATVPPRVSFSALVDRVAVTMREDLIHAKYPFAWLVDDLSPARGSGDHPFFDIVFVSQEVPPELAGDPDSSVQYLDFDLGVGPYNLVCALLDRGATIDLELRYRPDAFLDGAVEKLAAHLGVLLRESLADPDGVLADVPFDIEQPCWPARVLPPSSAPQVIHERFVQQAVSRPTAVAIRDRDHVVTYGELESQSALLAARLIGAGVGPETLVCVHLDRSADLIAAMLAVLRAGGAYVPIDSQVPAARVRQVIDDSGARIVVTRRALAANCVAPAVHVIVIDDPVGDISRPGRLPSVDADNLAYVIYTSGSTGVPKGCLITHRNVCRLFDQTARWFGFGPDDVWTMCHSPAFDFSVWEIWGALLTGGAVVVVPKETARNPEALYDLLWRAGVTVLSQTPSAFRHLAHAAAELRIECLRYVIFGGERLDPAILEPWTAVYGWTSPRLVNMYGITETTVHVTYRPMTAGDAGRPECSPIGEPIGDLGMYLLTDAGTVQLDGLPGVIHVGGAGVARGYHHRPDLTAERFLPDPFSPEPGGRMYDSGDLARWTCEDGLMFAGRHDRQVKIRGHRIELSEVETALRSLPAVKDAVAVARDPRSDGAKLFAYVTPAGRIRIDGREIRRALSRQLPEYLVPSQIIEVSAFPLTSNGKLDVDALPVRENVADERPTPMTPAERTLSDVWASVLGRDVGVDESFFDAGGDSLTAINVQSAAARRGLYFTVVDLHRHATIRALAAHASAGDSRPMSTEAAPLTLVPVCDRSRLPTDIEDAYPLCRLLAGHVFHSERRRDYETHVTSVHVGLPLDAGALAEAMEHVAAWHPALRTTVEASRYSVPLHLVHRSMVWEPAIADLSPLNPEAQREYLRKWIAAERRRRPDWSARPQARCHAHVTGGSSFELTLCEPFLDGWSVGVVLTDLLRTYSELLRGQPVSGRAVRCTVREHVLLERRAEEDEGQRQFWRQRVEALPECEPSARRHAAVGIERTEWQMPADLWKAIRTAAHAHGVSVRIALLAVHLKTMSTLTGSGDVVTGCLYNGRPERQDGERLVGIFVNALPFHVCFRPDDTWSSIVQRVHEEDLCLQDVRRFPYAELHRMHGRRDLFAVVFNFTNFHIYRDLQRTAGVTLLQAYASEQMYFDLTCQFHVDHMSDELLIALDYQRARYDGPEVKQWLDTYAAVAASFASGAFGAADAHDVASSLDARVDVLRARSEQAPADTTDHLASLLEKIERMTDEDAASAATGGAV